MDRNSSSRSNQEQAGFGVNGDHAEIDIPALLADESNQNLNRTQRFDSSSPTAKAFVNSRESVAHIKTTDSNNANGTVNKTDGSGFFVNSQGVLATDYHVIKAAKHGITVTTADGVPHAATVKAVDTTHDLALLQVQPNTADETFQAANLADNSEVDSGQQMNALGYPRDSNILHVSPGQMTGETTLAKFDLTGGLMPNEDPDRTVLKSDMSVQRGNSGGPLLGPDGKVVGIVDLNAVKQSTTISTPIEDLHALLKKTGIQPDGKANRPAVNYFARNDSDSAF